MEQDLLQFILVFVLGVAAGVGVMLLVNKVRSGSATPGNVREEYESYQAEVERHFEETSKKFKDMTAQYQDLYQHLSIGATSLCRPDSVAATLADERSPMDKLVDLSDPPNGADPVKQPVNTPPKSADEKNSKVASTSTNPKPGKSEPSVSGRPPQRGGKGAKTDHKTAVVKDAKSQVPKKA